MKKKECLIEESSDEVFEKCQVFESLLKGCLDYDRS
jgi:hypothetical protein